MQTVTKSQIINLIGNRADTNRAVSQAEIESFFDQYAVRFEPDVYDGFIKKGYPDKTARLLSTSYGLFQIMGYNLKSIGIDVTQEGRAGLYLANPAEQVNSYITFSNNLQKTYSKVNDFLAAYNGGKGAVDTLKTKGFYGKAEPYVYKVKTAMNQITPEDKFRYNLFQSAQPPTIVPAVILTLLIGGIAYKMRRKAA